jgi:L,D-transpeptidase-like protein
MLTRLASVLVALVALFGGLAAARADVVIVVNKSTQRLSVSVDGTPRYEWPVSTARMGYNTPNGTYGVERMEVQWFSRKYDWSPMPHSIFFNGGYAIHGSYEIGRLGTPASHGCIRLHPNNATILYRLVEANRHSTRIVVTGDRPSGMVMSSAHRSRPDRYQASQSYYDDEDGRPPRSIRNSRVRYRQGRDFEDIFNQAPDEDSSPDQDLAVRHYWNR